MRPCRKSHERLACRDNLCKQLLAIHRIRQLRQEDDRRQLLPARIRVVRRNRVVPRKVDCATIRTRHAAIEVCKLADLMRSPYVSHAYADDCRNIEPLPSSRLLLLELRLEHLELVHIARRRLERHHFLHLGDLEQLAGESAWARIAFDDRNLFAVPLGIMYAQMRNDLLDRGAVADKVAIGGLLDLSVRECLLSTPGRGGRWS